MASYDRNEYWYPSHHGSIVSDGFIAADGEGDNDNNSNNCSNTSGVVATSVRHHNNNNNNIDNHFYPSDGGQESAFDDIPDILLLNHYCSHGE
jgi:hypothetical protein